MTTGELATMFCRAWGQGQQWRHVGDAGPHEAHFLKLDCSRLKTAFGWQPHWHIQEAVKKTVAWAKLHAAGGDIAACMEEQIGEFFAEEDGSRLDG